MRVLYKVYLVCVIIGMFGVIYFDLFGNVIFFYFYLIINRFKICEIYLLFFDEYGYIDNNIWRILWYDILVYFKKVVIYFEIYG